MPDRIIRESSLNSPSLAQLSHGAERLFWRITVVADDSGRFDANPLVLKARCFPLLVDQIKTADVAKWINELSRECIQIYTVNGRQCGAFRNWSKYQRVYGNKSKFPDPPAECGELQQVPADSRSYPISDIRESIFDNRESINTRALVIVSGFEKFWTTYPKKKSKGDAEKAWNALKPDEQLQDRIHDALERAKTSADWRKDGGQYIPYPATWLRAKGWEDEHRPAKDPLAEQAQFLMGRG